MRQTPEPETGLQDEADESAGRGPAVFVASFPDFYLLYHARLATSLSLYFGDRDVGLEAADEAMTRAYQHWGTVSGHANPAGWVYRVGLNWGNSQFRRAKRRLPWHARAASEMPQTSDPAVMAALQRLNAKQRAVVVCRYFLDWSTHQTAEALEIPPGTVKSRLHNALAALRHELAE